MIANCGHLFKIMPLNGVTINYGWGMLKCLMMATFLCPPPSGGQHLLWSHHAWSCHHIRICTSTIPTISITISLAHF